MPAFPPAALDDVEAASQRATLESQNNFRVNMQAVAQSAQRTIDGSTFIAEQSRLAFLALMAQGGATAGNAGGILLERSSQAQPQTTGSLISPGVVSGVPAAGNTAPPQTPHA